MVSLHGDEHTHYYYLFLVSRPALFPAFYVTCKNWEWGWVQLAQEYNNRQTLIQ